MSRTIEPSDEDDPVLQLPMTLVSIKDRAKQLGTQSDVRLATFKRRVGTAQLNWIDTSKPSTRRYIGAAHLITSGVATSALTAPAFADTPGADWIS